jgi:serine/threonine protein kinase
MLAEKFQSESAILNKIRHANIVSVLDQGDGEDATAEGSFFLSVRRPSL